jgi:hypothetical protein
MKNLFCFFVAANFLFGWVFANAQTPSPTADPIQHIPVFPNFTHYPNTDSFLYSKSVNNGVPVSIFQESPVFANDGWDISPGNTALCGPSALSYALISKFVYQSGDPTALPEYSSVTNTIDGEKLVLRLAQECQTDHTDGTKIYNLGKCIHADINSSVNLTWLNTIPIPSPMPAEVISQSQLPNISLITNGLDRGKQVILLLSNLQYQPTTQNWKYITGHYVNAVGYAQQNSWNGNQILLKIHNPLMRYVVNLTNADFDVDLLQKLSTDNGIAAPVDSSAYFLEGDGFRESNVFVGKWFLTGVVVF